MVFSFLFFPHLKIHFAYVVLEKHTFFFFFADGATSNNVFDKAQISIGYALNTVLRLGKERKGKKNPLVKC